MKHVVKAAAPESFENWKTKGDGSWQPTYRDFQNPEKRSLHEALLDEQGGVCCYCGGEIHLSDSHIEHFRPQSSFEHLQLEFTNLHASCQGNEDAKNARHCGHAKGNAFADDKAISPLDASCEGHFVYTMQGEIASVDSANERSEYMIDLLSLNDPHLRDRRSEAISGVFGADFLETVTDDELIKLRDEHRTRDAEGKLPNFGHVIARYADQYVPKD